MKALRAIDDILCAFLLTQTATLPASALHPINTFLPVVEVLETTVAALAKG